MSARALSSSGFTLRVRLVRSGSNNLALPIHGGRRLLLQHQWCTAGSMSLIRLHLVLFCALSLACQSESPKTHVGVWELSEQGHLIRLELTASGSARMTVDDEEVLGN